ncbi:MAG: AraC family transcriptional regulator, partial [Pseudomonadota bacterium]
MSDIVTRQQMVDWMVAEGHSTATERLGEDWARLNAVVFTQGNVLVESAVAADFHLLEHYSNGSHRGFTDSELESFQGSSTLSRSGTLSFVQCDVPLRQQLEGKALLQQIYIDDAIFRETAAAIAPGDPDNLKPLGFQGIFEPNLKRIALDILEEARNPSAGGELYADLLAQQIALLILRRRLNGHEKQRQGHRLSDNELALVSTFLNEHIDDTGGLDTLARLIDMDVFSFTRAFKATVGETPHRYLIQLRLQRARDLLRNTH